MIVLALFTIALCLIIDDLGDIWTQIVSPEEEY